MNIDDVTDVGEMPEKIWLEIFKHQHSLELKYGPIEKRNGFFVTNLDEPINLDDAQTQNYIKNLLWRATEEFAEAVEEPVNLEKWRSRWETDHQIRHTYEEVADALHFFVAASISAGIEPGAVQFVWDTAPHGNRPTQLPLWPTLNQKMWEVVKYMGLAANCLKNKPWKSTHMPTDVGKFHTQMITAWLSFFNVWLEMGCHDVDIYQLYMKKNAVNQFRQRSNY